MAWSLTALWNTATANIEPTPSSQLLHVSPPLTWLSMHQPHCRELPCLVQATDEDAGERRLCKMTREGSLEQSKLDSITVKFLGLEPSQCLRVTPPTPCGVVSDLSINKVLLIIFLGVWNMPLFYIMKGKVNKIIPIVAILKYSIHGMLLFKNILVWFAPSMWTDSGT